MSLPERLETERLVLEPVRAEMAPELHEAVLRSLPELSPWMAWVDESLAARESWTRDVEQRMRDGGDRVFAILLAARPIGVVGVEKVDGLHRSGVLGYWLSSDHAGSGYMTEAAAAVVEHAFARMGLHRIELRAGVENFASNRVAINLGFRHEGVLRHADRGVYGFYDCNVYGLLEDDPRPRP